MRDARASAIDDVVALPCSGFVPARHRNSMPDDVRRVFEIASFGFQYGYCDKKSYPDERQVFIELTVSPTANRHA
ncbi:hypothetical protein KTE64_21265 [Burkholderia multivorans]|uniref:Uncharacterized protein n=1 Tax=Burkholderia multivorans TaxID=87883 RepID=A0A2S9M315_9BURK|nr:hypothetical protein [Burkholderia multivorans]MBU9514936.1 hypothetical protein [Burkholderia multivorans]MBU9527432.1 hypothetical protein [Burkholderia multivorans]MBU9540927.1 hypothetical protein [Burkholderia multivorans]MBU9639915.1 hypothetical protein [Burkholderia multivorans]